ncbi:hypothetical protein [Microbacterium sp. RG1]|nr:hypothetical protein [Microbacterium sp. RG1]
MTVSSPASTARRREVPELLQSVAFAGRARARGAVLQEFGPDAAITALRM